MKNRYNGQGTVADKTSYLVEFPCYATFMVEFEESVGLTERQIISKAQTLAAEPFANGGGLTTEFGRNGIVYACVAVGYEAQKAQITGKPLPEKPKLRVVK